MNTNTRKEDDMTDTGPKLTAALANALASADEDIQILRDTLTIVGRIVARNYPDAFDIQSRIRIALDQTDHTTEEPE